MLKRCRLKHVMDKNELTLLPSIGRLKPVFLLYLALLTVLPLEPSAAFATTRTRTLQQRQRDHQPNTFLSRGFRRDDSKQQPTIRLIILPTAISDDKLTDAHSSEEDVLPGVWPCFDELDSKLIKIALPVIANFAINPLIGAVDLFWINRMGNALAVAGQAAANQVCVSRWL
jgi:hypothetical protein